MNETERWSDGALPAGMDEMLREARAERPDDHVLEGTLVSLTAAGMLGAAGLTASAKATTPLAVKVGTTMLAIIKWKGAGWMVGALALSASVASHYGWFSGSQSEPPVVVGPSPAVQSEAPRAIHRQSRAAGEPGEAAALASASAELAVEVPPPDASGACSTTPPEASPRPPAANRGKHAPAPDRLQNPRFRRELALVDRARAAVSRGDAATALRLLAQYEQEFGSRGSFVPEVRYLKMQAHSMMGHRDRARQAARDILERDTDGAHSDRARSELERKAP